VIPGGGCALGRLYIDGMMVGIYRTPGRWERPGGAVYSPEDIGGRGGWSALVGQVIAASFVGGYKGPRWCECPGGAVYSQEYRQRIYQAREVGVRWRGFV
jgi:hypothetical protein